MAIARPKYLAHVIPNNECQEYVILNDMEVEKLMADKQCIICSNKVSRKLTAEALEEGFIYLRCNKCKRDTVIQVL